MSLYRWSADNLDPVSPTTFETEGLQERYRSAAAIT